MSSNIFVTPDRPVDLQALQKQVDAWRGYAEEMRERLTQRKDWDYLWWRIAIAPWLDSAIEQFTYLIGNYSEEPSEYAFEELAREVAHDHAPYLHGEIEALADIYPEIWEKADELDESWDDDIYGALQWAIGYFMFYELLELVPEGD